MYNKSNTFFTTCIIITLPKIIHKFVLPVHVITHSPSTLVDDPITIKNPSSNENRKGEEIPFE